jgi:hypothetical protein
MISVRAMTYVRPQVLGEYYRRQSAKVNATKV